MRRFAATISTSITTLSGAALGYTSVEAVHADTYTANNTPLEVSSQLLIESAQLFASLGGAAIGLCLGVAINYIANPKNHQQY